MLIDLKGVNKTYNNGQPLHVLKGIDLSIDKGEFVSIMGASGSGKSTLLNILGILDNYDTGEYWLDGKLIKDLSERQAAAYRNRMIGFIFQSFNLIGFKTAVENVELPLFYQGVSRHKRHMLAMEYLERLGLKDWSTHYPNETSVEVMDLLGQLNREENVTLIVVTHESGVANCTDKIIHIKDGVIGEIEMNSQHNASAFGTTTIMK